MRADPPLQQLDALAAHRQARQDAGVVDDDLACPGEIGRFRGCDSQRTDERACEPVGRCVSAFYPDDEHLGGFIGARSCRDLRNCFEFFSQGASRVGRMCSVCAFATRSLREREVEEALCNLRGRCALLEFFHP